MDALYQGFANGTRESPGMQFPGVCFPGFITGVLQEIQRDRDRNRIFIGYIRLSPAK